jgi:hypothetical protein
MIPNDVVRFESLLYVSLMLDALNAAIFGVFPDDPPAPARVNLLAAFFIGALAVLVWLAARRQKNWARWTVLGFFVLSVVSYAASFGEIPFGVRVLIDMVSMVLTAAGFYFSFTPQARRWFA